MATAAPPVVRRSKLPILIGILVVLDLGLLVTGHRVLVGETIVQPGERHVVQDWGNVGEADQASLVCTYWTGRSVKRKVFWYSSDNVVGRDQCPFLVNPNS